MDYPLLESNRQSVASAATIRATDTEAEQIKAALKEATGQDNLTEAEWDQLVARQRRLLAGE